ncbi:MAG TPA: sulfur carrier protein ThiS [Alphaproteobacteria bacterium]|nr:thiamine biosynthesis protein ThiS [Rhodospirillaceae bacterium]HRJ12758.1 sulfur carrier protein ThiS [Alphaproteobacteria bacterium]
MKIIVNGKEMQTNARTLAELVQSLGYAGDYFAVAQNMTAVPRLHYAETPLHENDDIEILTPMQGG